MRSNLGFILDRMTLNLAESGTDVTLRWKTFTGGTVDKVTQAHVGATEVVQTSTVKGFIHFVQIAGVSVREFNEVETGDCILDLPPDVVVDGLEQLSFTVDGQRWVPKEIGEKLAQTWDVVAQGNRIYRSVLCRKAT